MTKKCADAWYRLNLISDIFEYPISEGNIYQKGSCFFLKSSDPLAAEFLEVTDAPGNCEFITDVKKLCAELRKVSGIS